MSGSGAVKRNQAMALRVAKLAATGMTHREIAALVDKRPEQIKTLIELRERLREIALDRLLDGIDRQMVPEETKINAVKDGKK